MNRVFVTGKNGQFLVAALVFTAVASILVASILRLATSEIVRSENLAKERLADYLAEAGLEKAILELNKDGAYAGGSYSDLINGSYVVTVSTSGFDKIVTAYGLVPAGSTIQTAKTKSTRRATFNASPGGNHIIQMPVQDAVTTDQSGLIMGGNSTINGNVRTNGNITGQGNSKINGNATAAGTISSPDPTINGTKTAGAPTIPMPPFDYDYWRTQANINNDPISGFTLTTNDTRTYGPKKIIGDVTLKNSSVLYLSGPVHITGNLTLNNTAKITLDSSLITNHESAVMVVDGEIILNNSSKIEGGATDEFVIVGAAKIGDYGFINSGATSSTNNPPVVYANYSTVQFTTTSSGYTVVAKGIEIKNSVTVGVKTPLIDDSGNLSGTVSSPGSYSFVKGSYQEVK